MRTALRVFEEVAACQPVGLSELSRRLGVPKASVQRALTTLADTGWLRHDVGHPGQWVVTARFSVLADASPAVIAARDAARPHLRVLREKVQGWPGMFVLDGDRMVLLAGPEETTLRSLEATEGPLPGVADVVAHPAGVGEGAERPLHRGLGHVEASGQLAEPHRLAGRHLLEDPQRGADALHPPMLPQSAPRSASWTSTVVG